ncbi:MAG TPA: hypothetical protein VHP36_05255 [Chitinispirillaceae bacterium]|nr:hypothetical protein [Chitinispirillaceae bacterium]
MQKWVFHLISLTAIMVITGCGGVSQKSLDVAKKRIDDLKTQGIPDSMLSMAKVYLAQAVYSKDKGKTPDAQKAAAEMEKQLSEVENYYKNSVSNLLPSIESLKRQIKAAREEFSALQGKKIDSMLAVVDSFVGIKWYLQANTTAQEIISRIPQFRDDQKKANEIIKKIPGEWVCTNHIKGTENKEINALEKKIFSFDKKGSVKLVENKKGRSGPYLKEDYEYRSVGTWDVLGDTIYLFINRFTAVRQNFERMFKEGKKITWQKENHAPYDSTITDGSQDRNIIYADLLSDFEQTRRY